MAFARPHAPLADATFSAAGASAWNANQTPTGADVGGIPYCPTATTETTSANLTYTETSGPRLQVGSGSGTSAGWILGYFNTSGQSAIYSSAVTPGAQNYALRGSSTFTEINAPGAPGLFLSVASDQKMFFGATAGRGPSITAGTATTDVQALSATQTWNASGVTFTGIKYTITDTASAAGSLAMQILGGAAGTSQLLALSKTGALTVGNGSSTGHLNIGGDFSLAGGSQISWQASTIISASSGDGTLRLTNNAATDFGRLQFGGTTSSFPAIKRSSATLAVRLADDSADADLQLRATQHNGITFANVPGTPVAGMTVYITDSSTATWGATIAGGGANKVLAWYNGTNWTVAGA